MSASLTKRPNVVGATVEELFAYADAMEREAVRRYRQLSDMMTTHNNPELAALFARFVDIEQKHVDNVAAYAKQLSIPQGTVPSRPGAGLDGQEVMAFNEVHYLHTPFHAISIAHRFEERAALFYDEIARTTVNAEVREVAKHFAEEEIAHMKELEIWLARYPRPAEGWDEDPDPPVVVA